MKMVIMRQTENSEWMGLDGPQVLVSKADLLSLLERAEKLLKDMTPGVRYIALQDYRELNDVQVDVHRAVLQLKEQA